MKKNYTKKLFTLVSIALLIVSCRKAEPIIQKKKVVESNQKIDETNQIDERWIKEYSKNPVEEEKRYNEYMAKLPHFDMKKLPALINKLNQSHSKSGVAIWGVGAGNTVWKWDGSSWFEPNSAARLEFVNVSTYGGGVWGVDINQHIWKWDGASWYEPNSLAQGYYITSFTDQVALGMGFGGTMYITQDGGQSWSLFSSIQNVRYMSVANTVDNFCWIVQLNSGTYKLFNYDYSLGTWNYQSTPVTPRYVSAIWAGGAWFLQNGGYNIWKKNSNTGVFTQPNSSVVGLMQISAYGDDLHAWGVDPANRVWTTSNGGISWDEPNSAARLWTVSAGYE